MSKEKLLLGIDVGTTGVKAEVYDLQGNRVSKSYREYPLIKPKPDWVEEDAEGSWWGCTRDCIKEMIANGVDAARIAGVSVSCTNALVPVDKNGQALYNGIIQLDKRTIKQSDYIKAKMGKEIMERTGNQPAPGGTSAPIILWFKENEPEIFDKTYKFLWPGGFVNLKLTGEFTMEWSRASWTCLFDTKKTMDWIPEICEGLGIPMEKLPKTYPCWEIIGSVTKKAAEETGLIAGTPVLAGMADTPAAGVGTKAVVPGRTFIVVGTVGRPCVIQDKPNFDARFINCVHGVPNTWFTLGATDASGLSLRWVRDNLCNFEAIAANEINQSPYDFIDQIACESTPGAKGLIYLPYLTGERSPIWDPYARGVLFGLNVSHTKREVVRAFYEGVAFSCMHNVEIYEKDLKVEMGDEIYFSGGGAKSDILAQIHADVCNKKVTTVKVKESEALGNAILTGYALGLYKSIEEAADALVKTEKTFEPIPENVKKYQELFGIYKNVYLQLRDEFKALAKWRTAGN